MVDLENDTSGNRNGFNGGNINNTIIYEDDIQYDLYGSRRSPLQQNGLRLRNKSSFLNNDEFGEEMATGRKSDNDVQGALEIHDKDSSGEEHQNLIKRKKRANERMPRCYGFRRFMGWIISRERRQLHMSGRRSPSRYPTNRLNNQKYNILTLIPLVLFNQFKFFYNFFFLAIALS